MFEIAGLALGLQMAVLVMFVALHVLNRDYSLVRHAVSDYGVGRAARAFRLYLWLGIVALLLFAWLLHASRAPVFPPVVPIYLVLLAIARIGIMVFPADLEENRLTLTGATHYLFAIAGFTLIYLVVDRSTGLLADAPGQLAGEIPWVLLKSIVAASLATVVVTMMPPFRRFFGLAERAYILSYSVWLLLIAACALVGAFHVGVA